MAAAPGPSALWLVRHAESQGNVADARAAEAGATRLELDVRDPDVPLSATGRDQAEALGTWLRDLPAEQRPTALLSSPYTRAADTARLAVEGSGLDLRIRFDERLRERDFGAFDGMTRAGIRAEYPQEAERRDLLGKFYYRPPGGESWADVLLRLRSLLRELRDDHPDGRVLLFGHEATVLLVRYLCERLSEAELMAVAHSTSIANTSISSWRRVDGVLKPEVFNHVEHLRREGAPPTKQEDVNAEPV
jgi:broad specificity phosphatase PhoE